MYPSRIWSIIKYLDGKRAETPPNQPTTSYSKSFTHKVEIATAFAKQFTSAVSHISDPSERIVTAYRHLETYGPDTGAGMLLIHLQPPFSVMQEDLRYDRAKMAR